MHAAPRLVIIAFAAVGFVDAAGACTLARGYELWQLGPRIHYSEVLDAAPEVRIDEIKRGHKGETSACANWGSILLKVPAGDSGYSFEFIEGVNPGIAFPTEFVRSIGGNAHPGYLRFYWDDGAVDNQEPISFVVRITAVSRGGIFSEPTLLKVEHAGVRAVR